jgi:hypothetical protein
MPHWEVWKLAIQVGDSKIGRLVQNSRKKTSVTSRDSASHHPSFFAAPVFAQAFISAILKKVIYRYKAPRKPA